MAGVRVKSLQANVLAAGLLCINWDAARISREIHLEPAIIDYQVVS